MRASESKAAVECPHSLAVIREREDSPDRDDAADFGTLCHFWKETGRTNLRGAKPGHVKTLEKKLIMSGIRRNDYWPKGTGEHEVTFAYNLRTLEVRWYKGHRDKADAWKGKFRAQPEWLSGTADWVKPDGSIDDLKTGRWPVEAHGNKQLFSYAMPWWLELGKPLDYIRGLSITQWPRYPLDGLPRVNHGKVTGMDLAAHLGDLQWSLDNPSHAVPDEDTCRFCEGKPNCPDFLVSGISYERR